IRREELRSTLAAWSTAHAALCRRDAQSSVRIDSPATADELAALQPQFDAMFAAAATVVAQMSGADAAQAADPLTARAVRSLLEHEGEYLKKMDHVVTLLEQQAGYEVLRLRVAAVGIAAAVITLIVGLGWAVVRPATRTIRTQVDQLESRVALRTRELAEANLALRAEMDQRERAESKTQQLAIQLTHAARVSTLGHLAGGLAHELNQPLGAIANYAETCDVLLSHDAVDARPLRRHLVQIRQAAVRAGQIVRRIREFVRPQPQLPGPADLNLLVRDVAELCRAEAEQADVCLTLDLAAAKILVRVDPIQIQQVLVNLAQNAFQAMQTCPRGQRRVRIRTAAAESRVRVEVTDSGPGIPGEVLPSIFTPFCTTKPDGLGIGLAICRSIIERHSGEIWVRSPPGQGATIGFSLPCCPSHDGRDQASADSICCR
ncbi:MAG TPA: ATP-binding protein, partial [Pirellulales bacterium]|nr:ATP-binding protein [Pirellulales bacterium]